jgi:hypothetical protein
MERVQRPELKINDANWVAYQKYRGKQLLKEGKGLILPSGLVIDASPWKGFQHSVHVRGRVMHAPKELLKDPEPGCAYVWRPKDDPKHSTSGLVNKGYIKPVEFSRCDTDSNLFAEVYEYQGSSRTGEIVGYIGAGDYLMFEVRPDKAYEWFEQPVDATAARMLGVKGQFQQKAQQFADETGGELLSADFREEGVAKTVAQEMRHTTRSTPIIAGRGPD